MLLSFRNVVAFHNQFIENVKQKTMFIFLRMITSGRNKVISETDSLLILKFPLGN